GLDYYTKTAYEILSGDLGSQNAVAGGGRYDNLAAAIGGGKIPGVGFACGLDRAALVMEEQGCDFGQRPGVFVYCVALDNDSRGAVQVLTNELRMSGISAECDTSGRSFKAQMKSAGACKFAFIIGADERADDSVSIKNLADGSQVRIPRSEAVRHILGLRN
ncbi:MAG: ATP phosphoribosyltransferase regulatory subunit, partial [Synergistaceae bacterium]|nr:ATP phosphoribosyltransferase regulatory subunit [Synergistaceae bacterium]